MKYDLIIFDLDGTTLDTLDDLAISCNAALSACGYPARSREEVRMFVGSGIERLIARALPEGTSQEDFDRTLRAFKSHYAEHSADHTRPYPGIIDLLNSLRAAGLHTAINSNKIDSAVQNLCEKYLPDLYEMAMGEREGIPKKPSPDGVYRMMNVFHADPDRTLYVGDSQIDLLTAQNAGVDCAWVSWGLRRMDELDGIAVPHAFDDAEALGAFILEE